MLINLVKYVRYSKNVIKFWGGKRVSQSWGKSEVDVEKSGEVVATSR